LYYFITRPVSSLSFSFWKILFCGLLCLFSTQGWVRFMDLRDAVDSGELQKHLQNSPLPSYRNQGKVTKDAIFYYPTHSKILLSFFRNSESSKHQQTSGDTWVHRRANICTVGGYYCKGGRPLSEVGRPPEGPQQKRAKNKIM